MSTLFSYFIWMGAILNSPNASNSSSAVRRSLRWYFSFVIPDDFAENKRLRISIPHCSLIKSPADAILRNEQNHDCIVSLWASWVWKSGNSISYIYSMLLELQSLELQIFFAAKPALFMTHDSYDECHQFVYTIYTNWWESTVVEWLE